MGIPGTSLLIYCLWARLFRFELSIQLPIQPFNEGLIAIGRPVRSCFLKSAISDSWASMDRNSFQGDFIIASNGLVWARTSSSHLACAPALLQRHACGFFTKPAPAGFKSTFCVQAPMAFPCNVILL
jgi:hypothetical protein